MSKYLKVKDIIKCTNGELVIGDEDIVCENFSKDTRQIQENDTYIALKGDNFDGNLFWKEALNKGARVVITQNVDYSKENLDNYKGKVIINVNDTQKALIEIATSKRNLYGKDFSLVAVTGSVGKTSTKDIIASVLSKKYNVLKTEGNNNNNIGLPFTILRLKDHDAAVIEMGMNHLGEISELSKIAKPTLAVITNVGTSHIGILGSRENILKAKLEILDGMETPKVIINNDNDLLHKWYLENKDSLDINTFGIENKSDIFARNIKMGEQNSEFECEFDGENFNINVPVGGRHFVYNALCGTLVGKECGLTKEEIKLGIEQFELTKKRMEIHKFENGIILINDSYNASLESMKVAIEYLSNISANRKIAILGDMFELGDYSVELHKKVGEEVAKNKIDVLICCGENSKFIIEGAVNNGFDKENAFYVDNLTALENKIKEISKPGDAILIKASNGMKFFKVAEKLIESEM